MPHRPAEANRKLHDFEAMLAAAERYPSSRPSSKSLHRDGSLGQVCYLRLKELVKQARTDVANAVKLGDEAAGEQRLQGVMQLLKEMERVSGVLQAELGLTGGRSGEDGAPAA